MALDAPVATLLSRRFHKYGHVSRDVAQTLSLPRRHSCRRPASAETSLGAAGKSAWQECLRRI